jgi:hypothetical protein
MRSPGPDWVPRHEWFADGFPTVCEYCDQNYDDVPDGEWFRYFEEDRGIIATVEGSHGDYRVTIQFRISHKSPELPNIDVDAMGAYAMTEAGISILRVKRHGEIDPVTEVSAKKLIRWSRSHDTFQRMTAVENLVEHYRKKSEFEKLKAEWNNETSHLSSTNAMSMHPAYQRIIGMGYHAIFFMLEDLVENGPEHWFWALTAVTGENPVTEDIAGRVGLMSDAWIEWGKREGYLKG